VQVLDGDVVRQTLCKDLSFSEEARYENVRRIGIVADMLSSQGVTVLVAAITPLRAMRDVARGLCESFVEVFVDAPLGVCELRDPKGLYQRARRGEIIDFTGVSSPYERPLSPAIICATHEESLTVSVDRVLTYLKNVASPTFWY
jgi:adenylyl-sulfate kinase